MNILIIDDEKFLTENLSSYLEKKISAQIQCVDSACEAMELVNGGEFDLIICDLNISDQVNGELIRKIFEANPAQRFIIISAEEIPDHLKAESDIKISAYFEKPFNMSDFAKAIKEIENVNLSSAEL